MSIPTATHSIIEYFHPPEEQGHRCGYCKSPDTNHSHGMWAHTISPDNYEHLINVGWRRSGSYIYKPMNEKICCPMYTIRNLATKVEISRGQRKVLKRFRRYLKDGCDKPPPAARCQDDDKKCNDVRMEEFCDLSSSRPPIQTPDTPKQQQQQATTKPPPPVTNTTTNQFNPPTTTTTHNPHPLKKKRLRRERKRQKLQAKGLDPEEFFKRNERDRVKELEAFFTNKVSDDKLEFSTKLVRVDSAEFEEKYFEMEHAVYKKYQMGTHHDTEYECRASQFKRFLCDNPFSDDDCYEDDDEQVPTTRPQGTYHQHYYVASTLFAVGVIDILPHCISSVYFFYDPDYSFLSPGTLGALHEIHLVNELAKSNPKMEFYYLGFYIHSCVKMRYKSKFRPCQLLCPVRFEWAGFQGRVAGLLESVQGGFVELGGEGCRVDNRGDLAEKVLILHNRRVYKYKDFVEDVIRKKGSDDSIIRMLKSYADLVGSAVVCNMLVYVSAV